MADTVNKRVNIYFNNVESGTTVKALEQQYRKLNAELKNLTVGSKAYNDKMRELQGVNSQLTQHRSQVRGIEKAWQDAGVGIKLGIGVMVAAAAAGFAKVAGKVNETIGKFEKFEAILTNALGSRSKAQGALKQLNEFAKTTPFQIDELTDSYVKLVNRGFIPTQEEMRNIGDLAASQGKSFNQLVEAILDAQTMEYERLKEFGIKAKTEGDKVTLSFKDQKIQVDKTADAIKNAILQFGAMNGVAGSMSAISKTIEGMQSNLEDTVTNIYLAFGERAQGAIKATLTEVAKLANTFLEFVQIPVSEKLEAERMELNGLVTAIISTNDNQQLRNDLISELQQKYPDFLGNIETEAITNDLLSKRLAEVNQQMINKIILQRKEEELTKAQNEAAENYLTQYEKVKKLGALLAEAQQKYNVKLDDGLTLQQKAVEAARQLKEQADKATESGNPFAGVSFNPRVRLRSSINSIAAGLTISEVDYKKSVSITQQLADEQQKLMKELGITVTSEKEKETKALVEAEKKLTKEQKKELDKQRDQLKKHVDELMKLRIENMEEGAAKKEAQADYEYYQDVKRIQTEVNDEGVKFKLLEQLEIQYLKKIQDIRDKAEQEQLEKEFTRTEKLLQFERERQLKMERMVLQGITGIPFASGKPGDRKPEGGSTGKTGKWRDNISKPGDDITPDDIINTSQALVGQLDQVFSLMEQAEQRELDIFLEAQERKRKSIDDLYQQKIINETEYNKRVRALDAETDAKTKEAQRKGARRHKAIGLMNTAISTAMAVMNMLATAPWPVNLAMAALAGGMGLAQAGMIVATPEPAYAAGGPTIAQGGPVTKPTRAWVGEKGAEWVAPNWMLNDPVTADIIGMLEMMRQNRGYAAGGITMQAQRTPAESPLSATATGGNDLVAAIKSLNLKLSAPIKGYIVWRSGDTRELYEEMARLDENLSDNKLGG
jgi:hypothetical protein